MVVTEPLAVIFDIASGGNPADTLSRMAFKGYLGWP
jgi:hypothetical protein